MKITVNGEQKNVPDNCSITDLLNSLDMQNSFVAVAINNNCISRRQFDQTNIEKDDKIEILAPMAGG